MKTSQKRWIVTFGKCRNVYYTQYHAEQFYRALCLNGTACRIEATHA